MALDVRGKTVVLTGTFSKLKRAEAEKQLAALGAKIGGSVGKSTHILFAGEKAGSKIDAAGRLGVTVLGEDELMALLGGTSDTPASASVASSGFAALDPATPGPALAAAIEALPWDDFEANRDLPALREVLYAHEATHGITAAHRAATARLRPHATLGHAHGHDVDVLWCELSPDGRFLATGSWTGDDYDLGGVLQIWDVRAGRCVNRLRIRGGVGWPDYDGCIQWRPDGKRVGLAFDTNGVGSFDPFGKSGEPDSCAYVTDGWSRPPSWTWSPNNRDVYIACWGPNLALGAIVPLIGRRPEPRWCESVGREDPDDPGSEPKLEPPQSIDWSHPDRIVCSSDSVPFTIDAKTGKISFEQEAPPPACVKPSDAEVNGERVRFSHSAKGLVFSRERDGAEIGRFRPAVEASGESPLLIDGEDLGATWGWNPAFPLDHERVAAALPEGVVIGPPDASASVEEIDAKIAWVVNHKWAWPWRWGEAKVWPDVAAAAADPAAPTWLKRKFGKKGKAPVRTPKVEWPTRGGSLDDVAALVEEGIKKIGDGYHGVNYRRKFAERTMTLGLFDRAAAAIEGSGGWPEWNDPWFAARARAEVVVAALAWRKGEAPLTDVQMGTLRRWLGEAEIWLAKKEAKHQSPSPPRAMIGAGWVLLGEKARGEKLLTSAIATVDPENNATENRRVVAEALAAVGRIGEAADMLASGEQQPSWTETRHAFSTICPRASAAELQHLLARMKARDAHNEFVLLERGLTRLIALKEWDAALAWFSEFEGLSTTHSRIRLMTAMVASGEPARAEAAMAEALSPKYASSAEYLLAFARVAPERAGKHLETLTKAAPKLSKGGSSEFLRNLAGAAATLGRLDVAMKLEKVATGAPEVHEVCVGVLGALDPTHPEWNAWFTRARELLPKVRPMVQRLAALAFRGGLAEVSATLLDQAIEDARGEHYPDIALEQVVAEMAQAGDLAGAHRAFLSISKGMRSHRNGPLLSATTARGLWTATVELLRQMPQDLNGGPQRGLAILLAATDRDGF